MILRLLSRVFAFVAAFVESADRRLNHLVWGDHQVPASIVFFAAGVGLASTAVGWGAPVGALYLLAVGLWAAVRFGCDPGAFRPKADPTPRVEVRGVSR
jgi:hypothetical protein